MKACRMVMAVTFLGSLVVSNLLLLFVLVAHSPLFAESVIDVKQDKNKTVYTIGGSDRIRQEEAAERDKAMDTIKNMSPIIDKRRNTRHSTTGQ